MILASKNIEFAFKKDTTSIITKFEILVVYLTYKLKFLVVDIESKDILTWNAKVNKAWTGFSLKHLIVLEPVF